jgi:hypothetical protein
MRPLHVVGPIVFVALSFGPAEAQDDPHAGCAAPPTHVPATLLTRSVPLRDGIGNSGKLSPRNRRKRSFSTIRV